MPIRIQLGEYQLPAEVLTSLLEQFQLTGLFLSCFGGTGEALKRIWPRYEAVKVILELAEQDQPGAAKVTGTPVVYNPSCWHSDLLCGYAGDEFALTPTELLASHLECWAIGVNSEGIATSHFVKCILWLFENSDRNLSVALRFIVDLLSAGFITSFNMFRSIWWGFVEFYARAADVSFLKGQGLSNKSMLNQELQRVKTSMSQLPDSPDRTLEVIDWLIEYVTELAEEARGVRDLDAWLICLARLRVPALLASTVFHSQEFELSFMQRCLLSQIEEISADLHALFGSLELYSAHCLPLLWNLNLVKTVGAEYRKQYPADEWLDRLTDERLLIPNAVKERLSAAGELEPEEVQSPSDWRTWSEKIGVPLCVCLDRAPQTVRTRHFSVELLEQACVALGFEAPQKIDEMLGEKLTVGFVEDERLTVVRRSLMEAELRQELGYLHITFPDVSNRWLKDLRGLYPLHAVICRSSGIRASLLGQHDRAIHELRTALFLDPSDPETWLRTSGTCLQTKRLKDAGFFWAVSQMFARRRGH